MHPPSPGNGKGRCATTRTGPREKLNSDDADKIADPARDGKRGVTP